MDKLRGSFITKILVLATPVIWIAWDIYAEIYIGNPATESATILVWLYGHPGLSFLLGCLCGHLALSQRGRITWDKDLDKQS